MIDIKVKFKYSNELHLYARMCSSIFMDRTVIVSLFHSYTAFCLQVPRTTQCVISGKWCGKKE